MSCCGGKRAALRQNLIVPPAGRTQAVKYTGRTPVSVHGPITGKIYRFSPEQPLQDVDVRDAALLSQSAKFLE